MEDKNQFHSKYVPLSSLEVDIRWGNTQKAMAKKCKAFIVITHKS